MRIDFVDAGKAALTGIMWLGSIIGLTELFAWLEEKYKKRSKKKRRKDGF